MIRQIRRLVVVLLIAGPAAAAEAAEPGTAGSSPPIEITGRTLIIPPDAAKDAQAGSTESRSNKAAYQNSTPAVRFAMCGVEADGTNTSLDAGLIDFKIPETARAINYSAGDPRDSGRTVHDYNSPVFLGVTLGYHF